MSTKKYTDWSGYWEGLRTNLFKCIGTTGITWLGTNGLASSGIPGTSDMGLHIKTGVGMFAVHIGLEVFTYMKNKQPEVITETVDTSHIVKDPITGNVTEAGSSRTVTVTPVGELPTLPTTETPTTLKP